MDGAVDEDGDVHTVGVVSEIRPDVIAVDDLLGIVGKPEAVLFQQDEELLLQLAVAGLGQAFELCRSVLAAGSDSHTGCGKSARSRSTTRWRSRCWWSHWLL